MEYSSIVVLITVPSPEVGEEISTSLVEKKLAACVNIIPEISSIYQWQGTIEKDRENLLLVKTRIGLLDKIIVEISDIHPYDLPEVIALPIIAGSQDYLNWIDESTA
jgi:periplasmic divalent cation tolerance protein